MDFKNGIKKEFTWIWVHEQNPPKDLYVNIGGNHCQDVGMLVKVKGSLKWKLLRAKDLYESIDKFPYWTEIPSPQQIEMTDDVKRLLFREGIKAEKLPVLRFYRGANKKEVDMLFKLEEEKTTKKYSKKVKPEPTEQSKKTKANRGK